MIESIKNNRGKEVKVMITVTSTKVPLKAEDLLEYEATKRTWKKIEHSKQSSDSTVHSTEKPSAQIARKVEVQNRLGLANDYQGSK